jgi:hypothetical protein
MSTSPPVPIPVVVTSVTVPTVAVPITVPVAILFAVPVLSAIEQQEQCERTGRTSLLEKQLIIIQQLIVINEGQLCSFDKASVQVDIAGVRGHRTAECMTSLTEAKFLCYLRRSPNVPGNEKSGGIPLDNPHFTTWLHLSMLIDFETPLINPARKPCEAIYGEIIDINHSPFAILLSVIFELYVPPLKGNYCRLTIQSTMSQHTI